MSKPKDVREIAAAANDVLARVRELAGPKAAATALLTAHVLLTRQCEFSRAEVDAMLAEYPELFRDSYFHDQPKPN